MYAIYASHTPRAAMFAAIIDKCVTAMLISLSHCYQKHAGRDGNGTVIKSAKLTLMVMLISILAWFWNKCLFFQ